MRIQDLIKKRLSEREAFVDSLKSSKEIALADIMATSNNSHNDQDTGVDITMSNTNLEVN